ncbi:hypothetical protein NW764_016590, partial [Fusarium oxysporum]
MSNGNYRASYEEPFLTDEEKDLFETQKRLPKYERWAKLLPYSGLMNIALLLALLSTFAVREHHYNKAYIPNEIYSPVQSAVQYETVIFSGGLREEESNFQGSSRDVDKQWDELYN